MCEDECVDACGDACGEACGDACGVAVIKKVWFGLVWFMFLAESQTNAVLASILPHLVSASLVPNYAWPKI